MNDRQIKLAATNAEYSRVYDNYNLPPRAIFAMCSTGLWIREAWEGLNCFGWLRWKLSTDDQAEYYYC